MKVLMICGSYPPEKCGVGDYSKILINKLNLLSNLEVDVLTSNVLTSKHETINFNEKKWKIKDIFYFYNLINKQRYDLIHLQFPSKAYRKSIGIIFLMILLSIKNKIILTLHEYSDSPLIAKLRTWPLILLSKKIIVVDERYKRDIVKIKKSFSNKIEYINIGSNIPKSELLVDKKKLVSFKNTIADDDAIVLGYFGFVNKTKGLESILEAGKMLKERNEKFLILLICELSHDNKYHLELLNLIEEYNLKDNVKITGYLSSKDVANYLAICDFAVFPFTNGLSTKNGSFLAALLQETKVITTLSKDINTQNKCFEKVYFINDYSDVNKIIELINKHKNEEVVKSNEVNISWESISKKIFQLYEAK